MFSVNKIRHAFFFLYKNAKFLIELIKPAHLLANFRDIRDSLLSNSTSEYIFARVYNRREDTYSTILFSLFKSEHVTLILV